MLAIRRLLCAVLLSSAFAAVAAGPAAASHSQIAFFEAPGELLDPATRPATITKLQALGVKAIRVQLHWATVAPDPTSSKRPEFDATNPAAYNWGQYDVLLSEAARLHWKVLLTVTSPVPVWATPTHDKLGITRPSASEFGKFMTAVARHYASEVSLYAIWNEPNHHDFLRPQFNANGSPASPRIYRALYQAGYAGLQAGGISKPKVLMGETAPGGENRLNPHEGPLQNLAPLVFLRETLCLNKKYKKASTCGALVTAGYAHHAYSNKAGARYVPPSKENVTIGVLSRLTHALDLAAKAHAIPAHLPVYLTEFGVNSKPNKFLGVPVSTQAQFDAIAERIAYDNPRVASFSQYLLKDDPLSGTGPTGEVGFQTGLEYVSGAPKPLYFSFPIPLAVAKHGKGFSLWGLVRPATGATKVTVEVQGPHSSGFRKLKLVTTNSAGYWTLSSSTPGRAWRVRWTSPSGTLYSGPSIAAY